MGVYDAEIASAAEMIAEVGLPVTLIAFDKAYAPDPDRPWKKEGATPREQSTVGVFVGGWSAREGDTLQHEAREKLLVAAQGLTSPPNVNGILVAGGVRWRIAKVTPLAPNGEAILYEVEVAR